jgi:hypothetical protein
VKMARTPFGYGESPVSSLCLILWKSYLFSCRTKLAKLLCLKCFGRIVLVNWSVYTCDVNKLWRLVFKGIPLARNHTSNTTKVSPSFPHLTNVLYAGSSSILVKNASSVSTVARNRSIQDTIGRGVR